MPIHPFLCLVSASARWSPPIGRSDFVCRCVLFETLLLSYPVPTIRKEKKIQCSCLLRTIMNWIKISINTLIYPFKKKVFH